MKKLLVLVIFCAVNVQARTITLEIPDNDIKIVENDVLDAEQWIKDAWLGKLNSCKQRIVKQEIDRSVQARESIPAGETAIVNKAFNRTDYKNRKAREAEAR
jgi:hypothetical protein